MRTIVWVVISIAIMLFSILNWNPVEITLWNGILVETKVPALVILAFLLGLFPMWLYHRSVKWGLQRRIRSLESSIKSAALARQRETPVDTTADKPVDAPVEKPAEPLSPVDEAREESKP
ncbi:LapA family protein [Erythrobacter sp. SCSIO 43205]|uniref:LapA family protein n=1 Tax=Erythrobacter sp. SCSIO 43205 TaxID=2779361 RepID=UPI001CA9DB9D|nr:LapA family protein [Erythrobacter sp. SCSIO 43205]UAB77391.1 LapA family protein [Erythrobacter sp. SCSIO 43205]